MTMRLSISDDARHLEQVIRIEHAPHQPADQQDRDEDEDARQAAQVAEGQADQGRGKDAEAVQPDQVAINADDQGGHGQQQQELDQPLLGGRQDVQRDRSEEALDAGHALLLGSGLLDQEGVIDVGDVPAANQRLIAVAEDEVIGGHLAEMAVAGAHGQPAIAQPGLDPVMGPLLGDLVQGEAGHQAGGDAAIAQHGDQQPALGGAIAAAGLQALGRADRRAAHARLALDVVGDEAINRLGHVVGLRQAVR